MQSLFLNEFDPKQSECFTSVYENTRRSLSEAVVSCSGLRAQERAMSCPMGGLGKGQAGGAQAQQEKDRAASSCPSGLGPHTRWPPSDLCILHSTPDGKTARTRRAGEREDGVNSRRPHKAQRQLLSRIFYQNGGHARFLEFQRQNLHKLMLT